MKQILTEEQTEMLRVIQTYRTALRIKGLINESLGEPLTEIKDIVNLNNLYGLFFSALEDIK